MKHLKNLFLVIFLFSIAFWLGRKRPDPIPLLGIQEKSAQLGILPNFANEDLALSRSEAALSENLAPQQDDVIPQIQPGSMQIKNAFFSLLVKDVRESIQKITDTSSRLQGYIISSSVHEVDESGNLRGQISFKVPQAKFEEGLSELRDLAITVNSERVTGQDVSEEFTDLSARLRNKEASEEQLLALMEKTGSISDILGVQRELTRVREEIERLKGRIDYLEKNIAMSTITVDLSTELEYLPISEDDWRPLAVAKSALRILLKIIKMAVNIIIWLVVFTTPILILLILPFILLLKFFRKKR